MIKYTKTLLVAVSIFALGACSSQAKTKSEENYKSKVQEETVVNMITAKPGAAIAMRHDFSGKAVSGNTYIANVDLRENYANGLLAADIKTSNGISLLSGSGPYELDMSGSEALSFPIEFSVNESGVFFITVNSTVDLGTGQVLKRSFSIPVYSGVEPQKNATDIQSPDVSNPGVVVMQAQEEIIQK